MRVLLDDEPCSIDVASVGEALDRAARLAEARGRVVTEVVVDGTTWDETQLESATSRSATAREITLVSTDLKTLVTGTLQDGAEALTDADSLQREAATLIQADDLAKALEKLGEAFSIWINVHAAVSHCVAALQLDPAALEIGDDSLEGATKRLTQQLQSLKQGLEARDPVLLADTLLYEMPEVVTEWREVLQCLQHRATPASD